MCGLKCALGLSNIKKLVVWRYGFIISLAYRGLNVALKISKSELLFNSKARWIDLALFSGHRPLIIKKIFIQMFSPWLCNRQHVIKKWFSKWYVIHVFESAEMFFTLNFSTLIFIIVFISIWKCIIVSRYLWIGTNFVQLKTHEWAHLPVPVFSSLWQKRPRSTYINSDLWPSPHRAAVCCVPAHITGWWSACMVVSPYEPRPASTDLRPTLSCPHWTGW